MGLNLATRLNAVIISDCIVAQGKLMPIDYSEYPPDWSNIRAVVLARAGELCDRRGTIIREANCEDCGLENHYYYHRLKGNIVRACASDWGQSCPVCAIHKPVLIILTIAHLDHDPDNFEVCVDRLRAWCQKCHLAYDAPMRRINRDRKRGQAHLFPMATQAGMYRRPHLERD